MYLKKVGVQPPSYDDQADGVLCHGSREYNDTCIIDVNSYGGQISENIGHHPLELPCQGLLPKKATLEVVQY